MQKLAQNVLGPVIIKGVNDHITDMNNKFADKLGSLAPELAQTIATLDEISVSLGKIKKSLNC